METVDFLNIQKVEGICTDMLNHISDIEVIQTTLIASAYIISAIYTPTGRRCGIRLEYDGVQVDPTIPDIMIHMIRVLFEGCYTGMRREEARWGEGGKPYTDPWDNP